MNYTPTQMINPKKNNSKKSTNKTSKTKHKRTYKSLSPTPVAHLSQDIHEHYEQLITQQNLKREAFGIVLIFQIGLQNLTITNRKKFLPLYPN